MALHPVIATLWAEAIEDAKVVDSIPSSSVDSTYASVVVLQHNAKTGRDASLVECMIEFRRDMLRRRKGLAENIDLLKLREENARLLEERRKLWLKRAQRLEELRQENDDE